MSFVFLFSFSAVYDYISSFIFFLLSLSLSHSLFTVLAYFCFRFFKYVCLWKCKCTSISKLFALIYNRFLAFVLLPPFYYELVFSIFFFFFVSLLLRFVFLFIFLYMYVCISMYVCAFLLLFFQNSPVSRFMVWFHYFASCFVKKKRKKMKFNRNKN